VAEGYATALDVRRALGGAMPVVTAFDSGNLEPVAKALRKRYPADVAALRHRRDGDFTVNSVFHPRALGARRAMASSLRWLRCEKSRVFGRYWRSNPFTFSFDPRCQGLRARLSITMLQSIGACPSYDTRVSTVVKLCRARLS
jgi:hypothetical protein